MRRAIAVPGQEPKNLYVELRQMRQTVATGASPMDNSSTPFGKESPGQPGLGHIP